MKKILSLLLTFVCMLTVICGCEAINKMPVSLGSSVTVSKDGIIEAAVFEEMKAENKAVTFKGQSGDICYEWIIFGSDIKEPKALNLGIEIIQSDFETLRFRFLSNENFGFAPMLSIYPVDVWNAQSASVSKYPVSDASEVQEVSITGKNQTILNFAPKNQTGEFIITPNALPTVTLPASTDKRPVESPAMPSTSSLPNTVTSGKPTVSTTPETAQTSKPVMTSESRNPDTTEPPSVSGRPISDGQSTEQDEYNTDPVPEGRPLPVEPDRTQVDTHKVYTCTFSIECSSVFNNLSELNSEKLDILPKNGVIFASQTVVFYDGESVLDLLQRVCRENKIHLEASFTPMYNSAYVEGIGNLYEFDCGSGSGWMYRVDGWYPNYGCSRYQLKQGERVEWRYTCDLGSDIGGGYAVGE